MNKMQGIYKVTNKINNRIYVGSSNNIFYRWEQHVSQLIKHKHDNNDLQNDFIKQGENINNLTFEILEICRSDMDRNKLYDLEGEYIYKLKAYDSVVGYNKIINGFKKRIKKKKEVKIEDKTLLNEFNYCDTIDKHSITKLKENMKLLTITDFKKYRNKNNEDIYDNSFLSKSWTCKHKYIKKDMKNLIVNYFINKCNKEDNKLWTSYLCFKSDLQGKGYIKSFRLMNNTKIEDFDCCVFVGNIFLNTYVSDIPITKENNDRYALSFILLWIKNNINIDRKFELFIPSLRMYTLLNDFLNYIY